MVLRLEEKRQALAAAEVAKLEDERQYAEMQAESATARGELTALAAGSISEAALRCAAHRRQRASSPFPSRGRVTSPYGMRGTRSAAR